MRIVVTGGAGYIGSVITDELIARGHHVTVLDDLSKGHRDAVATAAHFVEISLLDRAGLSSALDAARVDAVVHMAASSLVGESMSGPGRYYRNNVEASLNLLDAMVDVGVKPIVFSSTAAVYGEPLKQPIAEGDPTNPSNTYGETKRVVEESLKWYRHAHDIRFVSLRYFNAAGATRTRGERHHPETHLIPLVLDVAHRGQGAVHVFGNDYPTPDGTCVRDYIHVTDLARAHVLALEALDAKAVTAERFNVGTGTGHSVREVLGAARAVTGRSIREHVAPRRPGDPAVLVAEAKRLTDILGWKPTSSSLPQIISSAWEWMTTRSD
jgi:UDP-glucose 4-epimerase